MLDQSTPEFRWQTKPRFGAKLNNKHHVVRQKLVSLYMLNEARGSFVRDITQKGVDLTAIDTNSVNSWTPSLETGISFTTAGASFTAPIGTAFDFLFPISFAFSFYNISANISTGTGGFGLSYSYPNGAPFHVWYLGKASNSNNLQLLWNANGTHYGQTIITLNNKTAYTVSATLLDGLQYAYVNGVQVYSGSSTGQPNYTATSSLSIGCLRGSNNTPNLTAYWGAIWNEKLPFKTHEFITANPKNIYQLFNPVIDNVFLYQYKSSPVSNIYLPSRRVLLGNDPFTLGEPSLLRR